MDLLSTFVPLLLLMALNANGVLCQWNHTIYVSNHGNDSISCWSGEGIDTACRTLDFAVRGIQDNSTRILLLSGLHGLNTTVKVANRNEIAIVGVGVNSTQIYCSYENHTGAGLYFASIKGLLLGNLTLANCGALFYGTVQNETSPDTTMQFRAAVYVLNTTDVLVDSVYLINGTRVGLTLFDTNGIISVLDSVFYGNTVPSEEEALYPGGGGLYIEYTYCTPGRTNHCDDKGNPYVRNNAYKIERCHFVNNRANAIGFNILVQGKGELTRSFGKGGGVAVTLRGHSTNNSFFISKCVFISNSARFGGGYDTQFYDSSSNNSVSLSLCVFDSNSASGDGGALLIGFEFYTQYEYQGGNHISVLHTKFINNTAKWGGAVEFFSSRTRNAEQVTNTVNFTNCTWSNNSAVIAPAIDLAPEAWSTLTDGYLPVPVFEDCLFLENYLIDADYNDQVSSSGILFVNTYTVNVTSTLTFRRNRGTALYLTAGSVNVLKGSTVVFDANDAVQGGAITLMGFSAIRTFPHSVLNFSNNYAIDVGGAIFASSIDVTDFLYSRNCFIRYVNSTVHPSQWKTNFFFDNNTAGTYGHSIYATTFFPCARAAMVNGSDTMNVSHVFRQPWAPFYYSNTKEYHNLASDPSQLRLNSAELRFAPGQIFDLYPIAEDDMNDTVVSVYKASTSHASHPVVIDCPFTYISDGRIRVTGPVNSSFKLTLQTTGFRRIETSATVTLSTCPPGFVIQGKLGASECVCSASTGKQYAGISQCDNFIALLSKGYWAGCSDTVEGSLLTAQCPLGYCRDINTQGNTIPLNMTCTELDTFLCGAKDRTGALCGECRDNLSVYFHSQRYLCSECKYSYMYLGWLFYILSELLPLTALFLVIMVFNISLTSGIANSFILFAQVLNFFQVDSLGSFVLPRRISILTVIYQVIFGFLNLDFFRLDHLSFCLWKGATVLDVLVIKYVTTAYAIFLLVIVIMAFRVCSCHSCPLRGSSILHGMSAFLIISYAQCAKVSFQILSGTELRGRGLSSQREVVFLSGTTVFFSKDHFPYAIPAIFVLLTICTIPTVLLLAYPTVNKFWSLFDREGCLELTRSVRIAGRCCRIYRLKPFLDCFQGCFKDNFRFFAGLSFVYRLAISAAFAFTSSGIAFYVGLEVVVVCILAIHAVAQPYKKRIYNIIDALIFADLAVINGISLYNFYWSQYQSTHEQNLVVAASIQVVLIYIPILYVITIISLKVASKFKRLRVKLRRLNQYIPLFSEEEYMELHDEDLFDEDHLPARLFEPDESPSAARNPHRSRRGYGAADKYKTF